jgi:hypothetical protein
MRVQEDSYFEIEIDAVRYDAVPAIGACIEEWESFLRDHGLM